VLHIFVKANQEDWSAAQPLLTAAHLGRVRQVVPAPVTSPACGDLLTSDRLPRIVNVSTFDTLAA
jgi:hypothetical protein